MTENSPEKTTQDASDPAAHVPQAESSDKTKLPASPTIITGAPAIIAQEVGELHLGRNFGSTFMLCIPACD